MLKKSQIKQILTIAKEAGDIILQYYEGYKSLSTTQKQDDSPVTAADIAANDFIIAKLKQEFPNLAIVSEENPEKQNLQAAKNSSYFMIDPLDGTSAFIKKMDDFTVNIALISDNKPIFGVIYLPVLDLMYFSDENFKSYKIKNYSSNSDNLEAIKVTNNQEMLKVICTKREPEKSQIIADLKSRNMTIKELISVSSSYKFCLIAEGKADLYPRRANIKAWDVAAGHAIVKGAGGSMIDYTTKKELIYKFSNSFEIAFFEVF